jgi:hypothetical protein
LNIQSHALAAYGTWEIQLHDINVKSGVVLEPSHLNLIVSFASNTIQFPYSNELYFGAPRTVLVRWHGQLG